MPALSHYNNAQKCLLVYRYCMCYEDVDDDDDTGVESVQHTGHCVVMVAHLAHT